MIATNNLTTTMQHFGNLSEAERELFLSVITTQHIEPKQEPKKTKKKELPYEFTEEGLYEKLIASNNSKVEKRLKKLKELEDSRKFKTIG